MNTAILPDSRVDGYFHDRPRITDGPEIWARAMAGKKRDLAKMREILMHEIHEVSYMLSWLHAAEEHAAEVHAGQHSSTSSSR